jgi:hypothetical protein
MYLEVGLFCVSELCFLMREEDLSDFKWSFDEESEGISSRDFRALNERALVSMKSLDGSRCFGSRKWKDIVIWQGNEKA